MIVIMIIMIMMILMIEGSLEVKFPTIWTDGKGELGRIREEKSQTENQRRERVRREKI